MGNCMDKKTYENSYFPLFSNSLVQASIVFIFLTYFFFTYVSDVEKTEFKKQINYIVDDIYLQNVDEIQKQFPTDPTKNKIVKIQVYGLIDSIEENLEKNTKKTIDQINQENSKTVKNSVLTVLVVLIITVLFFIIFGFFGYCAPFSNIIREGLFILIFVALTEYLFLNVISENYISIDSEAVKKIIAKSVIDYIDTRAH